MNAPRVCLALKPRAVKKPRRSNGFWIKKQNQAVVLDSVGQNLGVKSLNEWYSVTYKKVKEAGGVQVLQQYGGCLSIALASVYPQYTWQKYKFAKMPSAYWNVLSNRKNALEGISEELGIKTFDDWLKCTHHDILQCGGSGLLLRSGNSIYTMLNDTYKNYKWEQGISWKQVPDGYWDSMDNQRSLFDSLGLELDVYCMDEWYCINAKDIICRQGGTVLSLHNNTLSSALCAIYNEYEWSIEKFEMVPKRYFDDLQNQETFFDKVAEEFGITTVSGWYDVKYRVIVSMGGSGLMERYGKSMLKALKTIYPKFQWDSSRFRSSPARKVKQGYWQVTENALAFLKSLEARLLLKSPSDWLRVSQSDIVSMGGGGIANYYQTLLSKLYPMHIWRKADVVKTEKKSKQRLLVTYCKLLAA